MQEVQASQASCIHNFSVCTIVKFLKLEITFDLFVFLLWAVCHKFTGLAWVCFVKPSQARPNLTFSHCAIPFNQVYWLLYHMLALCSSNSCLGLFMFSICSCISGRGAGGRFLDTCRLFAHYQRVSRLLRGAADEVDSFLPMSANQTHPRVVAQLMQSVLSCWRVHATYFIALHREPPRENTE